MTDNFTIMNNINTLKLEEPQQFAVQQIDQQQLQENLAQLRTWDLQENQTLQDRRLQQQNQLLQQHQQDAGWLQLHYNNIAPVQAKQAAQGQPKQEYAPPKRSLGQKIKAFFQRKSAKKHHSAADENSYEMVNAMAQRKANIDNAAARNGGIPRQVPYDARVLLDFCQGFAVNKKGEPANEQEAEKMRQDQQFFEDYKSQDAQRRKPHLDRIVRDIINVEIGDHMTRDPYVVEHAAELCSLTQKLLLLENIQRDNKQYFEDLKTNDPLTYALYQSRSALAPGFNSAVQIAFLTHHVDLISNTYADETMPAEFRETVIESGRASYITESATAKKIADEAVQAEIDKRIDQRRTEIAQQREEILKEDSEAAQTISKAGLLADNKPHSAATVMEYQDLILKNQDRYALHKDVVDKAYAELYKAIDTKDDLLVQLKCTLEYGDRFMPDQPGFNQVLQYVSNREAELKEFSRNIGIQITCLENLLKHILRGDQLEASGTVAATRLGYSMPTKDVPRTLQDAMDNTQYRNTVLDENGEQRVTFYTKEDQNVSIAADNIQKDKNTQAELAQTSAEYTYAYKTQASAIGRLLWMGTPPHAEQLTEVHSQLSMLGSKMYEPIQISGKDKQSRLESAKDQLSNLQEQLEQAIEKCQGYVGLRFGLSKTKRAAKRLVEETLKTLQKDYKKLTNEVAPLAYRLLTEEMTFGEVLGVSRATVIDLDREKEKVGKTGANMSDVITVGSGAEKLFFKEEEKLPVPTEVFTAKFMSSEQDQQKYSKFLPLLTDVQNMSLNKALINPALEQGTAMISSLIAKYSESKPGDYKAADMVTQMYMGDYTKDLAKLGLSIPELSNILQNVSSTLNKPVVGFDNLAGTAKISGNSNIAMRNVATSRMASLLGVGDLVVKSTTAIVQEKDQVQRKGIVMERARGQSAGEVDMAVDEKMTATKNQTLAAKRQAKEAYEKAKAASGADLEKVTQEYNQTLQELQRIEEETLAKDKITYTPDAVRQLVNLHLLDLICGQTDRHMNNYFVTTNEQNQIDGIQGIDNDVAFGQLSGENIMRKNGHLKGMKLMELPAVDADLYDHICSLTSPVLQVTFGDLLSEQEIAALTDRIEKVRNYLTERINAKKLVQVEKDQWTAEHAALFNNNAYSGYVEKKYL